jgi:uncharacterized protein (DUF2236 family)
VTVSRDDLERCIDELRADVTDPRAGLFGPESLSWLVDREAINFLCAGRAALLQLAHPFVAHAIDQHSDTKRDPLRRFRRTFAFVYSMIFGDMDHAFACARRVHRIHEHIHGGIDEDVGPFQRGSRYEANNEDALYWVYATLHDSAVVAFEHVIRPLTTHERDRYLVESHRFARLFGIPERLLHHRWSDFVAYNERMWSWVAVGGPARETADFLLRAPRPALEPIARWYRTMTTGLLPEPVRQGFGFRFTRRDRVAFDASLVALRQSYRLLPLKLREVPAHAHARRRIVGIPGRDRWASFVERHLIDTGITAATRAAGAARRAR